MQVLYECCAGLDVHKKTVVACILRTAQNGQVTKAIQTFDTMTADLLALADWLEQAGVTHVALESTGVFWKPVYNLLEDTFAVLLVNPQHIKAVPGRKTDVRDSEWIADLLRHGLLGASFIPPKPLRALRNLTRYRKTLVQERAQEVNRLQKVLEEANLKLASVATDVLGVSGRAMLEAILGGATDPTVLADLAKGRLRARLPDLRRALEGRVLAQHLLLVRHILDHIDFLDGKIADLTGQIEKHLAPFAEAVERLQEIPGVGPTAAATIVAEIGPEVSHFPSAKHLASWAGVCPGNKQSGGKRLSGKTRQGNTALRAVLGEVAWAIAHTKDNYLSAQFHRLARKLGHQKAVIAVAHSVLTIIYHMLSEGTHYADLGADYFQRQDAERLQRHHLHKLEQLGFQVTLTPISAA